MLAFTCRAGSNVALYFLGVLGLVCFVSAVVGFFGMHFFRSARRWIKTAAHEHVSWGPKLT